MFKNIRFYLLFPLNISLCLASVSLSTLVDIESVKAQITPANPNDTNTTINTNQDLNQNFVGVSGGRESGTNLFHSFDEFNVDSQTSVTFGLPNNNIENVINRVVGGNSSVIDGTINFFIPGVEFPNAPNFYLMNPAGIIFGSGANLDTFSSFTATTANGIRFGNDNWFSASGTNNYTALTGNPTAFGFTMSQPGGIDIRGNLDVSGGNLNLVAGSVVSSGEISGNQVNMTTVPGNSVVTLTEPGNLLSLEIQPISESSTQPNDWNLSILSLPELLTAGSGGNANRFIDNGDGSVTLSGSGIRVENGDVALENIIESAYGGSVGNAIDAEESVNILANRNLLVEGGIETSADDITLSADEGNISIFSIEGGESGIDGNFNITAGQDITIQNLNTTESNISLLNAGGDINIQNIFDGGGGPNSGGNASLNAGESITVENIDMINGDVSLTALEDITVGEINTSEGGDVSLNTEENIIAGDINTSNSFFGTTANVTLNAQGDITFNSINTQANIDFESDINNVGGNVNITAGGIIQGTGTIPNEESDIPANTTILTRGNTPGSINISHKGGENNVPFTVGDASDNGTAGAIDSGVNSRIVAGEFSVLPNGGDATNTPNGITISSVNSPPNFSAEPKLITTENQPAEFSFEDLKTELSDPDNDNTFVQIDEITAGTLTLTRNNQSVAVTPGTRIIPGDELEYTPPENASGNINGFTISGGDGAGFTPQSIGVTAVPQEDSQNIQKEAQPEPPFNPPKFPTNPLPPVNIDPVVFNIDNKFAAAYESYFNFSKKERVSLVKAREILLKIEKAAGVKPAIVYASFTPIQVDINLSQNKQLIKRNQLDLVLVTGSGEAIRKTIHTANQEEVSAVANQFYDAVLEPNNNNYLVPAQKLHQWIVKPLEADLKAKGINNLLFITDKNLRSIPLAALHDGKQFLVEKYSVGLTPSLSLTNTEYKDVRNSQVLAMGASKFQNENDLPAVPQEVSTIANDIWQGKSFIDNDFTLSNLKSQKDKFGIIHLATHGKFNGGPPEESFILISDKKLNLNQFGDLKFNEPAVELLVLSACETAMGDEQAELGFAGFAVRTGAKTALAGLWQVDDSATLGLMAEFYQQLRKAPIKSEALRQAQIAMLKGEVRVENGQLRTLTRGVPLPPEVLENVSKQNITTLAHPYYWAAFTMIGNPW